MRDVYCLLRKHGISYIQYEIEMEFIMSRVGREPISIPEKVEVKIGEGKIKAKGPQGELEREIPSGLEVVVENNQILVKRLKEDKKTKSLHGTIRSLIFNMIEGVSGGFEKFLEIVGTGYRATLEDKTLSLSLGYSHLVIYVPPEDTEVELISPTSLRIFGCDKQRVGEIAAVIRAFKKPEPYKGKGIRYKGEVVRRKAGKAALGTKGQ